MMTVAQIPGITLTINCIVLKTNRTLEAWRINASTLLIKIEFGIRIEERRGGSLVHLGKKTSCWSGRKKKWRRQSEFMKGDDILRMIFFGGEKTIKVCDQQRNFIHSNVSKTGFFLLFATYILHE